MEEKINKKMNELSEFKKEMFEDIDFEPPTILDKKILKKYQEIWEIILEICQKEKISDMREFDKKYSVCQFGLNDFIDEYKNHMFYCSDMDDSNSLVEDEIKLLKEIMEQFKIDKDTKIENELLIIRDTYVIGKEQEAEKELDKWIKKHPKIGEGYEVKCDWELNKENPNMEKIAEILDIASDNDTFVPDEDIYDEVIQYFNDIGNDEMAEYYMALLDKIKEDEYKEDWDEDYENDFEEMTEKEKQEIIDIMKSKANDKVEKNKKIEQYILEKNGEELTFLVGTQILFEIENMKEIRKDLKNYILKNYERLVKENLTFLSIELIKELRTIKDDGIVEKELEDISIEDLEEIDKYFLLKQNGIAFMSFKDNKITIHIPMIKEIKKFLDNIEVVRKNKEFNEKVEIISGMCEIHGAIKVKRIMNIMEEFYGEVDKEQFAKHLLIICKLLGKAEIKIDNRSGNLQFIYNSYISEKTAKGIIKLNKENTNYSKEEYMKYACPYFLKNTKGYKRIIKEFSNILFFDESMLNVIEMVLLPYTMEVRLGEGNERKIIAPIINELKEMQQLFGIDVKEIEKGFKEIAEEYPSWK